MDSKHLFDGFSSNAVISIIAVMIIGAGLDKTGIMSKVAAFILKIEAPRREGLFRLFPPPVGFISSLCRTLVPRHFFSCRHVFPPVPDCPCRVY